jgi:hypothetical protein
VQEPDSERVELLVSVLNELVERGALALGCVPEIDNDTLLVNRRNSEQEVLKRIAADILDI